ncbi:MAG TPA: peptide ABC transporter substrate-binding protein [Caldisericia bacterium]|nr:peptide ABC transporter substrate-binding protein [Caldisericia bacterium]HOC79384.1 peptide ABC transporter substrate-binding protein [Caldisericia bacterium]HOG70807.1 peptide ABC transporter substrate-binding protein [Caldisericia bacterium]HPA66029.1 peptide ABC transporter substrate-binding protein [Caldisericia bacterium]HPM45269.1 peptide ABC transporter substrate-binding protein [Caldisericia bacterium]
MRRFLGVFVCFMLAVGLFAYAVPAKAATQEHWATKYVSEMTSDGVKALAPREDWDSEITAADFVKGLSVILGKDIPAPEGTFNRAIMVKLAVDNHTYAEQLKDFDFPAWCLSNDEETIPKDFVPYFNMAYRPVHQLLTYRKNRVTAWDKTPLFSEAAYILYMLKYPPNTDPGQQIVVVTAQEPDTLNPFTTSALSATLLGTFYGAGDITYDSDATKYPNAALRVPTLDNGDVKLFKDPITGKDKMTVTYRFRPGMYFPPLPGEEEGSRLHEITADDALFGFRVAVSPVIQSVVRTGILKYDYVKKVDKYTIEVGYNEVYVFGTWGIGWTFKAKFEPDFYTDPGNFNVRDDFRDYEVGPYRIKTWERGDHIEFEPNPYAIFAQPIVKKIIVKFMPDANTIRLNLQGGNVDITTNAFDPTDASELEKKLPRVKFYYTPGTSFEHVTPNLFEDETGKAFYFGDARVRRAMLYALDREQLTKITSGGIFSVAHSWLTPKSKYYDDKSLVKYEYNPAKAEQLFEEAGWKLANVDGENIRCWQGDPTKPFKVTLATTSENPFRQKNVEEMIKMWARVGLKIIPQLRPSKELFGGKVLSQHQFELVEFAWVSNPVRPNALMWRSDQIPTQANNWSGQNISGWKGNKENDSIVSELEKELPDAKLQELLNKQIRIWGENLPILPLFNRYDVDTATRDIQNIKPTGSQRTINWNCAFWYREKK